MRTYSWQRAFSSRRASRRRLDGSLGGAARLALALGRSLERRARRADRWASGDGRDVSAVEAVEAAVGELDESEVFVMENKL